MTTGSKRVFFLAQPIIPMLTSREICCFPPCCCYHLSSHFPTTKGGTNLTTDSVVVKGLLRIVFVKHCFYDVFATILVNVRRYAQFVPGPHRALEGKIPKTWRKLCVLPIFFASRISQPSSQAYVSNCVNIHNFNDNDEMV